MRTPILFTIAIAGALCLVVQAFDLDDRLDAWLAAKIQPGDDGCWLEAVKIAGWLTMFIIFAVVNVGGYL